MAEGSDRVSEGTGGETGSGESSVKRRNGSRFWAENFDPYRDRGIKTPCLNCKDRTSACHTACEKYKAYKDAYQAAKEKIYKESLGKIEAAKARNEHIAEQQRRVRRGRAKEKQWTSWDG